jgi:osmotically-inducible protein OsmY
MNSSPRPDHLSGRRGIAAAALSLAAISFAAYAQDPNPEAPAAQSAGQGSLSSADAATLAQVKSALNSSSGVETRHINVSMAKGDVVLTGIVQNSRALLDAARIASKAAGGRKVVNNLSVEQNPPNAP